uniref:Uncharacterized protein n=1 Tax=Populus alba TaxID=43335 RepID=A0A4U5PSD8_POPAL|nr:hypothetical protein D5086_0000192280 [Populus alba]
MQDVLVPTEIDQEVEDWYDGHKMKTKSWESERICWGLDDNMVILEIRGGEGRTEKPLETRLALRASLDFTKGLSHSSSARPTVADSIESSDNSSSIVAPFHISSNDFCTVSSSGRSSSPAASSISGSSSPRLVSTPTPDTPRSATVGSVATSHLTQHRELQQQGNCQQPCNNQHLPSAP